MRHPIEQRLRRALAMLAWLDGRDPVPLDTLAQRFGVTRRQLAADLAAMGSMGGDWDYPEIVIDEGADTVEVGRVPHPLCNPGQLSRVEAFAVLAVGQAAVELLGPDDVPALRSALGKLEAALEEGRALAVDLAAPGHLATVRQAIEEHRTLSIDYWSAWRDRLSSRRVDPLTVFYGSGEWYLTAHDHASGQLRRFRVDRILSCERTEDRFEPREPAPETKPDHDVFAAPTEGTRAAEPEVQATEVVVTFPAEAAWVGEYVAGEALGPARADGSFRMRLVSVGETWLARLLLRTAGEVDEPVELRTLRRDTARRVLAERYGTPADEP